LGNGSSLGTFESIFTRMWCGTWRATAFRTAVMVVSWSPPLFVSSFMIWSMTMSAVVFWSVSSFVLWTMSPFLFRARGTWQFLTRQFSVLIPIQFFQNGFRLFEFLSRNLAILIGVK
jgi:hypothetical protein